MERSTITFRRAIDDDLPYVQQMVVDLCHELEHETDPESCYESVAEHWANPIIDCFVAVREKPVGVAAFMTVPAMYNKSILNAHECFWYVEPEYRGVTGIKLLKHVEKNLQCDILDFGISNPRLQRLLLRSGYTNHKSIMRKSSWV